MNMNLKHTANLLKKSLRQDQRIGTQLKLISVHIPKTAGTSFRNTLCAVYGQTAVARLDIHLEDEQIRLNEQDFEALDLPRRVRVVHGHFSPKLLEKYFQIDPTTPVITWLRNPVERVVSNYYYLQSRLQEELREEEKGLNILSKMQRTLLEYAAAEVNQNRMSKFLAGRSLREFAFVGIQEFYETDLATMGHQMSWEQPPAFHHNATEKKEELSAAEYQAIAAWNAADMALYQEGLSLRQQRLAIDD
ncbi:MAG: hypothetical protein DA408_14370 [Bacteroidetes bacterium]|nr:MAG: hypothetical protein C7N36_13255 [Bacteroidota bacterium]PTM11101.1 MAG: hypothetical protein DA408_14370 [Bacteroidota bacterium]